MKYFYIVREVESANITSLEAVDSTTCELLLCVSYSSKYARTQTLVPVPRKSMVFGRKNGRYETNCNAWQNLRGADTMKHRLRRKGPMEAVMLELGFCFFLGFFVF